MNSTFQTLHFSERRIENRLLNYLCICVCVFPQHYSSASQTRLCVSPTSFTRIGSVCLSLLGLVHGLRGSDAAVSGRARNRERL